MLRTGVLGEHGITERYNGAAKGKSWRLHSDQHAGWRAGERTRLRVSQPPHRLAFRNVTTLNMGYGHTALPLRYTLRTPPTVFRIFSVL